MKSLKLLYSVQRVSSESDENVNCLTLFHFWPAASNGLKQDDELTWTTEQSG